MRSSLITLVALTGIACSAGGTNLRRDAGPSGMLDGGPGMSGADAGPVVRPDAGPARDSGPPPPDAGCAATTPVATTIIGDPPDMLLTVDVSGSMCSPLVDTFPPSMTTKLSIMKMALTSLVTEMEARINFGLMLFPGDGACGAGTVRNPIAPRNATAINATVGGLSSDFFGCAFANTGATPTHTSLDAARAYYGTVPVNPIGRYVLLATDGLPNCGPELPEGGTEETVDETIAAIAALRAAGINTYVLGFGADFTGSDATLRQMAEAGGTTTPFNARSAAELSTALDAIAAAIIPPSCVVSLSGPTRDPRLFQVRFDGGALIPRDESHASGWDYDAAASTITFYGAECAAVESGSVASVDVDFGCPGPLI